MVDTSATTLVADVTEHTLYKLRAGQPRAYELRQGGEIISGVAIPLQCREDGTDCVVLIPNWPAKSVITHTVIIIPSFAEFQIPLPVLSKRWRPHSTPDSSAWVRDPDPQTALTHELGHALGLAHEVAPGYGAKCAPDAPTVVMADGACRKLPGGEGQVVARYPTFDDLCGLRYLYSSTKTKCPIPVGSATPPTAWGDADGNCIVDIFDYNLVVRDMNKGRPGYPALPAYPNGDVDHDGDVDVFDSNLVTRDKGRNCITWGV
jgi:hypothetical protein